MEGWRRVALFSGVVGGIVLAMWVSFTPLVAVSEVHPAEEQNRLVHGGYFPSDDDRRLAALSPEDYVEAITGGRVSEVSGARWQTTVLALRDGRGPAQWRSSRIGSLHPSVYFHSTEDPVFRVSDVAAANGQGEAYLRVVGEGEPALLRLRRVNISLDDFHLGTGWANVVRPPSRLLFPVRRWAPWVVLSGVLLYLFLPGIRPRAGTVRYSRKRLVLSDFVAMVMFGLFFALPMLIPEGFQPALRYWPVVVVFWLMAAPFVFVLVFSARYAAWAVDVGDRELILTTPQGRETIPYSEVIGKRPAELSSPSWIRCLLWAGALLNPGPGTAGSAVLLGRVLAYGSELELADGSIRYIWAGDALGSSTLENGDLLAAALDRIPSGAEGTATLKTFGMPLRGLRSA